jgi:hypothetical protein
LKASKAHNNGKRLEFIKLYDCRMEGKAIELLRILRLRDALTECVVSKAFHDMAEFDIIGEILLSEGFGDLL